MTPEEFTDKLIDAATAAFSDQIKTDTREDMLLIISAMRSAPRSLLATGVVADLLEKALAL